MYSSDEALSLSRRPSGGAHFPSIPGSQAGSGFSILRSENNNNFINNAQQKAATRGGRRGSLQFSVRFPYPFSGPSPRGWTRRATPPSGKGRSVVAGLCSLLAPSLRFPPPTREGKIGGGRPVQLARAQFTLRAVQGSVVRGGVRARVEENLGGNEARERRFVRYALRAPSLGWQPYKACCYARGVPLRNLCHSWPVCGGRPSGPGKSGRCSLLRRTNRGLQQRPACNLQRRMRSCASTVLTRLPVSYGQGCASECTGSGRTLSN